MKEPTPEQLRKQIREALTRYSTDPDQQAAMLSGISLAATFLAKLEGGKTRPQHVVSAVAEVGKQMGLSIQRLKR